MLIKLLFASWNVRGLGRKQKRDDVRAAIDTFLPSILCLQESKLSSISSFFASTFLPPSLRSFVFKPSDGASGGIITAWDASLVDLVFHSIDDFSITTIFAFRSDNLLFSVINVYGPCLHAQKSLFLSSLEHILSTLSSPVSVLGDFNLIRLPKEKSNDNFNTPFVQEAKRLVEERLTLEAKLRQLQEEHNDSLREVDALKKSLGQLEQKAETAAEAKERLELELTKAAEAKERLQQEAADR
uniref:Uncharacterized protein n=1 Tax=Avena sativa TaxID=4498 RepID=A0ACD6AXA2_AVESA